MRTITINHYFNDMAMYPDKLRIYISEDGRVTIEDSDYTVIIDKNVTEVGWEPGSNLWIDKEM